MKLIFMGTPALAVPCLEALAGEHEVALVVTQPDKPAGRGRQPQASPVKAWAQERGVPVAQPFKAREESFIQVLREAAPEAIVVVAYGQILPRAILELPLEKRADSGCINLHYSLLPRWRGAAPVQHALLNGDATTGVTTQWMAPQLDAGDIVLQREVAIEPHQTTGDLWQTLTPIGVQVLRDTMRLVEAGAAPRIAQDESRVTLAPSLKKENGFIDWAQPSRPIINRVRAMNPWPGAWCRFRGQTLQIWRARSTDATEKSEMTGLAPGCWVEAASGGHGITTGDGIVLPLEVQLEGKARMEAAAWLRGARPQHGQLLSEG